MTHCGHKGNRPSRCARWPLRQTNVAVPDTVIFAVKPENGASLERSKAAHYNLRLLLVVQVNFPPAEILCSNLECPPERARVAWEREHMTKSFIIESKLLK